jgi:uncharacterized membrane protein
MKLNLWHKKISIFVLAGIAYLVGQYFRGVWFLGSSIPNVCGHAEAGGVPFCNSPYLDTLGYPLIVLGQMLALVGIVMLFADERGWRRWLKFSLVYVPIATALTFWMYPTHSLLGAPVPITQGVYLFGYPYVFITLGIVLLSWIQAWRARRNRTSAAR